MVRTQIYLPKDLYETVKARARAKNISFAEFVRINLKKTVKPKEEKTLKERFPFIGVIIEGGQGSSDNKEIDKAIYDL